MIAINSSNIRAVEYNEEQKIFTVQFQTGKLYRYIGVPLEKYNAFLAAPSKGQFLAQEIKNSYPVEPV